MVSEHYFDLQQVAPENTGLIPRIFGILEFPNIYKSNIFMKIILGDSTSDSSAAPQSTSDESSKSSMTSRSMVMTDQNKVHGGKAQSN